MGHWPRPACTLLDAISTCLCRLLNLSNTPMPARVHRVHRAPAVHHVSCCSDALRQCLLHVLGGVGLVALALVGGVPAGAQHEGRREAPAAAPAQQSTEMRSRGVTTCCAVKRCDNLLCCAEPMMLPLPYSSRAHQCAVKPVQRCLLFQLLAPHTTAQASDMLSSAPSPPLLPLPAAHQAYMPAPAP